MLVYVYAICKNEQAFVDRWANSMKEADGMVVLDTGSSDRTVERLRKAGVTVFEQKVSPWRFDTARNLALSLVPEQADICVCTDLDEVFETGWRKKVEAAWRAGVRQLRYRYTWRFTSDGREDVVFFADKIHARHGFRWKHPVHEVLVCEQGTPTLGVAHGVQLNHYPDTAKSRGQYLPLLEQAVAEDPYDDRNCHYLGREYFFYRRYEDCIATLHRHLSLPRATWRDERCASYRLIAKSYERLGKDDLAQSNYLFACGQAPHLREPWLDLARFYYRRRVWQGVIFACETALGIQNRPDTYITEGASYGSEPYDLLSLGYYYTGQLQKAVAAVDRAIALAPDDDRLRQNRRWMTGEKVVG